MQSIPQISPRCESLVRITTFDTGPSDIPVTMEEYSKFRVTKFRVLSLRDGKEHKSPWFSNRENAQRALEVIQNKGHQAVIFVD